MEPRHKEEPSHLWNPAVRGTQPPVEPSCLCSPAEKWLQIVFFAHPTKAHNSDKIMTAVSPEIYLSLPFPTNFLQISIPFSLGHPDTGHEDTRHQDTQKPDTRPRQPDTRHKKDTQTPRQQIPWMGLGCSGQTLPPQLAVLISVFEVNS